MKNKKKMIFLKSYYKRQSKNITLIKRYRISKDFHPNK